MPEPLVPSKIHLKYAQHALFFGNLLYFDRIHKWWLERDLSQGGLCLERFQYHMEKTSNTVAVLKNKSKIPLKN